MPSSWIYWSLLTIVMFGLWGIFAKLAVDEIGWKYSTLFYAIGVIWIIPLLYFNNPSQLSQPLSFYPVLFAVLSGVVSVVALIGFNLALTTAEASVVVPLTGIYPVVTITLGLLFLHEKLNFKQAAGIGLAILAIILLSS